MSNYNIFFLVSYCVHYFLIRDLFIEIAFNCSLNLKKKIKRLLIWVEKKNTNRIQNLYSVTIGRLFINKIWG